MNIDVEAWRPRIASALRRALDALMREQLVELGLPFDEAVAAEVAKQVDWTLPDEGVVGFVSELPALDLSDEALEAWLIDDMRAEFRCRFAKGDMGV